MKNSTFRISRVQNLFLDIPSSRTLKAEYLKTFQKNIAINIEKYLCHLAILIIFYIQKSHDYIIKIKTYLGSTTCCLHEK